MWQRFGHGLKDEHMHTSVFRVRAYSDTFSKSDTILMCPEGKFEIDNKDLFTFLKFPTVQLRHWSVQFHKQI